MRIFIVIRGVEHVEVTIVETAAPADNQDDDQGDHEDKEAEDDSDNDGDDMGATG